MYKLCFYVAQSHREIVKEAVFAAGAGRIGQYDKCCWEVLGQGQFRPLEGSAPFIGAQGALEVVPEYRVEMVCDAAHIHGAIDALLAAHPYEEPAWNVIALETQFTP